MIVNDEEVYGGVKSNGRKSGKKCTEKESNWIGNYYDKTMYFLEVT